jgi:hypothetical protein
LENYEDVYRSLADYTRLEEEEFLRADIANS